MNSNAVRFFHRYSIHTLAPALLLMSACATSPPPERFADAAYVSTDRIEGGPVLDEDHPHRVDYDCQGIRISIEYGVKIARVTWPDGYDVLELKPSKAGSDELRYQSAHGEVLVGRDLLWGVEGGLPRSCLVHR